MAFLLPAIEPAAQVQIFNQCVAKAEIKYQVPACILRAVHDIESNGSLAPGLVRSNTNGTKDYSVTQINTIWMRYFWRNFGLPSSAFTNDACLAVNGTAYIIRYEINAAGGHFWEGVGNYHSHTPVEHEQYVQKVARRSQEYGCQIK